MKFFDHMRDGVSQSERQLEALLPAYVQIDGRSQDDLLMFLAQIASQFNYYNFDNKIDGDWRDFFSADMIILLTGIARLDFTPYQHEQLDIQLQMQLAGTEAQLHASLTAFFNLMYGVALQLTGSLQKLKIVDKEGAAWSYAEQLTESMGLDIYQLLLYEKQAQDLFSEQVPLRSAAISAGLQQLFGDVLLKAATSEETPIFLGYQSLQEIYNSLRAKFYQVTSSAQFYLDRKPADTKHHPHIGLLMAFTQLYGHLQEQLNDVTRRHLDYYYQTVLGIEPRKATPDSVHVFFELLPQSTPLTIPAGALMEAEINKNVVTYALQQPVRVGHAQIRSLKTLFASSRRQISATNLQDTDIRETQIYIADHAVLAPAAYAPTAPPVQPWALMGEEQHDLSGDQRTMEDASTGFIIASPVLYLPEGYRTVQLTIYFDSLTFSQLEAYVKNYASVVHRREESVFNELLSAAFILNYTTEKGWETIPRYSINHGGDNNLVINFVLDINATATAIYNPAVHGDNYEAALPMLKLLLNNNSFHHPYSFMNHLRMERITVNARVKGYRSVKLYNNIGPLSPLNPFQLFGPQPAVGSYLQIRDSNVFNKYTQDFCIRLEWLELPAVETGFDAYYAAYNAGMTNSSFKVGLSALGNGQFMPERGRQQMFSLFETMRGADERLYLSDNSILDDVDLQKINFNNQPLMDKEILVQDAFFSDGAIKLELATPADAFGHRLYGQLFPEVVTHNAGRWTKKKPIPNLPYIPLVKTIFIDYTLEQTELLKADKANTNSKGMQVIHLYPFGYRQAYPLPGQSDFFILPQLEDSVNLYIGFENLRPQEELDIYFQLEDTNAGQTTRKLPAIKWSYLYNDDWIPFEAASMYTDTTHQFVNSGVVSLKMPAINSYGNTRLDPNLQWLRASASEVLNTKPMVKGIFLNGGKATRIDNSGILPALSIKALQKEIRGISKLWQLFPSFGGRPAETAREFNIRVSERLRHKDRPILGIDLIQLVLDAFPEILIAKCIPGNDFTDTDLQMVVVPKVAYDVEEPKANLATLYRIKEYLETKLPPFVKLSVNNAVYETVKVCCDICFVKDNTGANNNYYLGKLQEDLRRYLNPWLYDPSSDLKIGSVLYKSEILNFIKRLPYVAYVTAFSLVHFFTERDTITRRHIHCVLDTAVDDIAYLQGSVPDAVLIPAATHNIQVIDEWIYRDPSPIGISSAITGNELIVGRNAEPDPDQLSSAYPEGEMITLTIQSNQVYGNE
jgi:hypothetical protein